jgi:hypothetical protein
MSKSQIPPFIPNLLPTVAFDLDIRCKNISFNQSSRAHPESCVFPGNLRSEPIVTFRSRLSSSPLELPLLVSVASYAPRRRTKVHHVLFRDSAPEEWATRQRLAFGQLRAQAL